MEYVEAIRDTGKIKAIKKYLKDQSVRDYLLFVLGINTGLKISEILTIKWSDILNENGSIKNFLEREEQKIPIYVNSKVKQAISLYLSSISYHYSDYVFKSSKTNEPITRQQAYRIINKAAKHVGIEGNIGTHSMRKTFGYHAYKKGIAIALLQKIFHHTSSSETLKYLGIKKEEEIKTEIDVNL
ncbi:tyrosine-type recombinase/integrase [Robertmurraya korlensis]|uniref:tyrosine-type recombinase/integrase n=1 Tax=Robertmurraya korlensis TaxID=519977 RepID=UPI0008260302|nr:tyrosine-type recombinase/integrase [Robertmurraya korlensis]